MLKCQLKMVVSGEVLVASIDISDHEVIPVGF